jgi:hypothetical protein
MVTGSSLTCLNGRSKYNHPFIVSNSYRNDVFDLV